MCARSWEKQVGAFVAVRAETGSLYMVTYQSRGNEGSGFRRIAAEVVNDTGRTLRIREPVGYGAKWPLPASEPEQCDEHHGDDGIKDPADETNAHRS